MDYRILITGCNGQLGEILCEFLSKSFKVYGTSNSKKNVYDYEFLDITDSLLVEHILDKYNPNIIINSAAITDVDYCELNKKECYNVNVLGLKNLIKYSSSNTKIIHFSTDFVYSGESNICTEFNIPNPTNYYGKSKLESENVLIGSNRNYLILRISTLFSYKKNNFFTWVHNSLNNKIPINVATDQVVNPSYADYLAFSLQELIILDVNGLYNYGSVDSISKYNFSILIANMFNLDRSLIIGVKVTELPLKANRPLNTSLDCSKIKDSFDLYLPYINESLEHLKRNYHE